MPRRETNLAATAEVSEVALMAIAGHRSFATTQQYVHLAGRVFPDAAAALERRLGAGRKFYPPQPTAADLSESEAAREAASGPA